MLVVTIERQKRQRYHHSPQIHPFSMGMHRRPVNSIQRISHRYDMGYPRNSQVHHPQWQQQLLLWHLVLEATSENGSPFLQKNLVILSLQVEMPTLSPPFITIPRAKKKIRLRPRPSRKIFTCNQEPFPTIHHQLA